MLLSICPNQKLEIYCLLCFLLLLVWNTLWSIWNLNSFTLPRLICNCYQFACKSRWIYHIYSYFASTQRSSTRSKAVCKSLVLLKNGKDPWNPLLPLDRKAKRILVIGSHADDLGFQRGGWTITWYGSSGMITINMFFYFTSLKFKMMIQWHYTVSTYWILVSFVMFLRKFVRPSMTI